MKTLIGCFLLILLPASAPAATDGEIATQFYPQALVDEYETWNETFYAVPMLHQEVRADLDRSGNADHLVVAYSNGNAGAVRVLRVTGESALLVYEPTDFVFIGTNPTMEARDLDGDGRPEFVATFSGMHGYEAWVFRWNGRLDSIGPTEATQHGVFSIAFNGTFEDVDGDSRPELLLPPERLSGDLLSATYTLTPTGYEAGPPTLLIEEFVRHEGGPTTQTIDEIAAEPGTYRLRVINGVKSNPVASATITVNGKAELQPSDFKPTTHILTKDIQLGSTNQIGVALAGKPDSGLRIVLQKLP